MRALLGRVALILVMMLMAQAAGAAMVTCVEGCAQSSGSGMAGCSALRAHIPAVCPAQLVAGEQALTGGAQPPAGPALALAVGYPAARAGDRDIRPAVPTLRSGPPPYLLYHRFRN